MEEDMISVKQEKSAAAHRSSRTTQKEKEKPLKILLLEDNPGDVRLTKRALAESRAPVFTVEWIKDLPEAFLPLSQGAVDLVLADLNLPSSTGLATLKSLHSHARRIPIVVMTGSCLENTLGQEALRQGAQDYFNKQDIDSHLLARTLVFAWERNRLECFKQDFLQNIAHEFRTPLTIAYGYLRWIIESEDPKQPLPREQRQFLEISRRSIAHLNRLVEEFVEATRCETGKIRVLPRWTDLERLAREAVQEMLLVAKEKGVSLTLLSPGSVAPVLADPKRCRQVIFNLLGNAIKFTPASGSVSIEMRACLPEEMLLICVTDTGPGIASADCERIFDRLYQAPERTSSQGLGLGLFICQKIITQQGGRLWVESELGRGSRFFFTLPIFSMAKLLTPRLAGSRQDNFWLLTVGILPPDHGLPGILAVELFADAAAVLLEEAGPQTALLPEGMFVNAGLTHFLLIRGNSASAQAYARRIEEALISLHGRGAQPSLRLEALDGRAQTTGELEALLASALDRERA
jgi:signal transduction histidine kinase